MVENKVEVLLRISKANLVRAEKRLSDLCCKQKIFCSGQ